MNFLNLQIKNGDSCKNTQVSNKNIGIFVIPPIRSLLTANRNGYF